MNSQSFIGISSWSKALSADSIRVVTEPLYICPSSKCSQYIDFNIVMYLCLSSVTKSSVLTFFSLSLNSPIDFPAPAGASFCSRCLNSYASDISEQDLASTF